MTPQNSYWEIFTNRRVGVMLFLGFSSGLPLALTSGTLQAWLTVEGVDLHTIGLFTLVGLPYTLKFFWSPVMDRFVPPWMGRRRGWMLTTQIGLMVGIAAIGFSSPKHAPLAVAALALVVAFLSASQDIAFDAYRAEIFGWMKTVGGLRKTRVLGIERTQLLAHLSGAAYNLLRISRLCPATG